MELNKLTKLVDTEISLKQKRQMVRTRRRNKRNRNYYNNNNEDSDESNEHEYDDDDERDSDENRRNRDRLEETPDQHCPFWDAYDSMNQYYLEIGKFGKMAKWMRLMD